MKQARELPIVALDGRVRKSIEQSLRHSRKTNKQKQQTLMGPPEKIITHIEYKKNVQQLVPPSHWWSSFVFFDFLLCEL